MTDCLLSPEGGPKRAGKKTVLHHEKMGMDESLTPTLTLICLSPIFHMTLCLFTSLCF